MENLVTTLNFHNSSEPNLAKLVQAAISGETQEYMQQQKEKNLLLQDITISKLFTILEQEQPLFTLSRQILISFTIEKITGTSISDKMQVYRGFLLNWEKILIMFSLFQRIAEIEGLESIKNTASKCIKSNQNMFEDMWGEQFPFGVIRPGLANKTINFNSPLKLQNMFSMQRRLSNKVINGIKKSTALRKRLKKMVLLTEDEIVNSGLNGPIARALNIKPSILSTNNNFPKDSQFYQQYVYANSSSSFTPLEICFTELQLALERLSFLISLLKGHIKENNVREMQGRFTCSFPVNFGVNHLTVELENNQVKYTNFIPFETDNLLGISKLLRKNAEELNPLILLFLNPVI